MSAEGAFPSVELMLDPFAPSVRFSFDKQTGEPDGATKTAVAALLIDLIHSALAAVSKAAQDQTKSKESLLLSLDAALPKTLSKALNISQQVDGITFHCLKVLIRDEVKKGLDPFISGSPLCITASFGFNSMVKFTTELLTVANKVANGFAAQQVKQKEKALREPPKPCLQEELSEALRGMVAPFLNSAAAEDSKDVYSESASEIQVLSEELAASFNDASEEEPLTFLEQKITFFFIKCFLNVWVRRLVGELKGKFPCNDKVKNANLVESFISFVMSWLKMKNQNSSIVIHRVSDRDKVVFMERLTQLLYFHFSGGSGMTTQRDAEVDADVKATVWRFEGLMNWFLKQLVKTLTEKMLRTLLRFKEKPLADLSQRGARDTLEDTEEPGEAPAPSKEEEEPGEAPAPSEEEEEPGEASASASSDDEEEGEEGSAPSEDEEEPREASASSDDEEEAEEAPVCPEGKEGPTEASASPGEGKELQEGPLSVDGPQKGSTSPECKEESTEASTSPGPEDPVCPGGKEETRAASSFHEEEEKAEEMTDGEEEPKGASAAPEPEEEQQLEASNELVHVEEKPQKAPVSPEEVAKEEASGSKEQAEQEGASDSPVGILEDNPKLQEEPEEIPASLEGATAPEGTPVSPEEAEPERASAPKLEATGVEAAGSPDVEVSSDVDEKPEESSSSPEEETESEEAWEKQELEDSSELAWTEEMPQKGPVSPEEVAEEEAAGSPEVEEEPKEGSIVPQFEHEQVVLLELRCEDEPLEALSSPEFEMEAVKSSQLSKSGEGEGPQQLTASLELREGQEAALASSQSEKQQQGHSACLEREEERGGASVPALSDKEEQGNSDESGGEEQPSPISSEEAEPEEASASPRQEKQDEDLEDTLASPQQEEEEEASVMSLHCETQQQEDLDDLVLKENLRGVSPFPLCEEQAEGALSVSVCEQASQMINEMEKRQTIVRLIISRIVDHIYSEAKMVLHNHGDLLTLLFEYIWNQVQDEDLCISDRTFKKMNKTIHQMLCKAVGSPNKVLFFLKYSEEPVVADCMVSIVKKLLGRPTKKPSLIVRFFSSLCGCVQTSL